MKTPEKVRLQMILRHVFMALSIAGLTLMVLNLAVYFGIGSDGPFVRGWVTSVTEHAPVVIPHPDGSGDYKAYPWYTQKLVMLQFKDMSGVLKARYLGYIFFQNLAWALGVFILYQMFRIFRNLDLGAVFHAENTRRIRYIAVAALLFPITRFVADNLMTGIAYEAEGHSIQTARPPLMLEPIIAGVFVSLVIFALAEVFRNGTQLQQEQDLTI